MSKAKKVLLFGATGPIGTYLVDEYLKKGFEVYVTSRSLRSSNDAKLSYIKGNAKDISFVNEVLDTHKFDVLVDFMVYSTDEFSAVYEKLLSKVNQYIFVSTYRVFSDSEYIDELTPKIINTTVDEEYLSTDEYALAKCRQESLLQLAESSNWTIVRPSITYGLGRLQLGVNEIDLVLSRGLNQLPVLMPFEIMDKYATMTWAGDVAKMISGLTLKKEALSNDFNILTHNYKTWREITSIYKGIIGCEIVERSMAELISIGFSPWNLKYDRFYNRRCINNKVCDFLNLEKHLFMPLEDGLSFEINNSKELYQQERFTVNRKHGRIDRLMKLKRFPKSSSVRNLISYFIGRFVILDKMFK